MAIVSAKADPKGWDMNLSAAPFHGFRIEIMRTVRANRHDAAILPGRLCDMARRGDSGPLGSMARFSFGPLSADSYERDLEILSRCV